MNPRDLLLGNGEWKRDRNPHSKVGDIGDLQLLDKKIKFGHGGPENRLVEWTIGFILETSKQTGPLTHRNSLVGGWTNPSEKYARQIGNLPQFSGWT